MTTEAPVTTVRVEGKAYLTLQGASDLIFDKTGRRIQTTTLTTYGSRGTAGGKSTRKGEPFPKPALKLGRTSLYLPADVTAWIKALPGQGQGGDYEKRSANRAAKAAASRPLSRVGIE